MAFSSDKSVGQHIDELAGLHQRYIDGDPTLTEAQIDDMRHRTNTQAWWDVQEKRHLKSNKITPISAGRTDQQKAEECRARLLMALAPVADILTEAAKDGLLVNFQFGQPDSFKRVALANLEILKKLC